MTGYTLLFLMGITLGVAGAGGAILTIPILIYFFNIPAILATTYSLFIVGITAAFGVVRYRTLVSSKEALKFAIPSVIGVVLTRSYLLPILPREIIGISLDKIIIILLVNIMFLASYFMIKGPVSNNHDDNSQKENLLFTLIMPLLLGLVLGLIGAGGGFLIVPILVLFLKVPVKRAIATSLSVVMINSIAGFIADRQPFSTDDYKILIIMSVVSLVGMFLGTSFGGKLPEKSLKQIFGWFVATIATIIALREFYF